MGPDIAPPPPPSPPPYPAGPVHRRLMRSSRERMWAGVCGGLGEYFDLDPSLIRLLWVAATIVSGGLAVPVYILAWIILPRDDRSTAQGTYPWRDWSQEFHNETQRLAEEARRMAGDVRQTTQSWHEPTPPPPEESREPFAPRRHHHHSRSTGVILVGLGVLLLAGQAGIFNWVDWHTMWPLIFIGLGLLLLARQADWRS